MRRLRLLLVLTSVGALATCGTASAFVDPIAGDEAHARSARALGMLESAARSARTLTWSGTQYVSSWQGGTESSALLDVQHDPVAGSVVRVLAPGTAAAELPAGQLDARLLGLLADRFELVLTGSATSAGRTVKVVEARRSDRSVAGRFWVDDASGIVVRREVLDAQGRTVRAAAFVDLVVAGAQGAGAQGAGAPGTAAQQVAAQGTEPVAEVPQPLPTGQPLDTVALARLEAQGWPVQRSLPGDLELYDARLHDGQVLQLSYSDGLSTTSVFAQHGVLPAVDTTGAHTASAGGPERVVWSGAGMTWTLLSDAPQETVDAAVDAMPHADGPKPDDAVLPRTWRGMGRVGSWLNPFD